jgi:hypothetical protein
LASFATTLFKETGMADNLADRSQQDRLRINVNEEWEVQHWTRTFKCSEDALRAAVQRVGVMVDDVRRDLERRRSAEKTS